MSSPRRSFWPKTPVYWTDGDVPKISVPFTWSLPGVRAKLEMLHLAYRRVIVGGPGVYLLPEYLAGIPNLEIGYDEPDVLQRINHNATRTTIGCPNHCGFCAIGKGLVEPGGFRELSDWPDLPVLCDNNLFAASESHFDRVMDRLEKHQFADFNQGVDARLLTDYHAERIGRVKGAIVRPALDLMAYADVWEEGFRRLRAAKVALRRIRAYALIGWKTGPAEAWHRCRWIESHGVMALPMWFHPLDTLEWNAVTPDQRALGWDDEERQAIMQFYYHHRGQRRYMAEAS